MEIYRQTINANVPDAVENTGKGFGSRAPRGSGADPLTRRSGLKPEAEKLLASGPMEVTNLHYFPAICKCSEMVFY